MTSLKRSATAILAASCGLFLAACQTEEQAVKPVTPAPATETATVAPPAPPAETPEQLAEKAARASAEAERDSVLVLYNNGDYYGAIKRGLAVEDDLKIYKDLELDTIKHVAFSYCLTKNTKLCRTQFEKALKLDPTFTLGGDDGHPMWTPAFHQAKKALKIK
ncbi:MAG TPA: TssQ family T6SS-associated lipoprotein [Burkholderiaceae bacterium]